jgi:hypothetical protein
VTHGPPRYRHRVRVDWLPWRRDWSQHPTVWRAYVAYALVGAVAATYYFAAGRLFGVFWAALTVASLAMSRYVYLRSRPAPDDEPA